MIIMNVNKSPYLNLIFWLICALGTPVILWSQGPTSAYRELSTATGMVLTDTIEGIDLQAITIEPSANHGDVYIHLISAGGPGTPNRFQVRYTPHPTFEGVDTFTLELNQFFTYPHLHYLAYRVMVYPSMLTVKEDFTTTYTNTPVVVNVLGNDNSSAGALTLSEVAVANHGTAYINAQNQVVFTPQQGFNGVALIGYVACDPVGNCKTGQLSVGVRPVSQPANSTLPLATAQNTSTQVSLQYGGYTLWQAPAHGAVQMISNRAFRYTPNTDYTGPDPFILRRNMNGSNTTITVDMKVLPSPPRNTMAVNDYIYTPTGVPVTFNVRQNDLGNLTVSEWGTPGSGGALSNTNAQGFATFTPAAGFSGTVVFPYYIGNGVADNLESGTVTIVVSDMEPALDTFHLLTRSSQPFVVDYPIPYDVFNFQVTQAPAHGSCQFYPGYSSQTIAGQHIEGYNLMVYRPNAGYTGHDVFSINYCLTANGACRSTVIDMQAVNIANGGAACSQDCVWPGDANKDGIVNNKDLLTMGFCMGQEGAPRSQASTSWYGQQASNWANPYVSLHTDLKFADADGNGSINKADADAILQHYGRTDNVIPAVPLTKKGLPFFFNLLTPNASIGDRVEVEVWLGNAGEPVLNLYGMTFEALLSSNIVDSAFQMEYYNNSWINRNSPFLSLGVESQPGRLESAFTRTNGQPVSGFGAIGKFSFIIIDIIDVGRPDDFTFYSLSMSNSSVQWGDGVLTNGSNIDLKIPLPSGQSRPRSMDNNPESGLRIFPSPANSIVQITPESGISLQSVSLLDMHGRTVLQEQNPDPYGATLDVSLLPNGLYLVSAQTDKGVVTKKVEVVK